MSDPVFNSQTQHYYELVSTSPSISWETAFATANASRFRGLTGYLATITSLSENVFVGGIVGPTSNIGGYYYIGGSDRELEGVWRWVNGPESGQLISSSFENWFQGRNGSRAEPNGAPVILGDGRVNPYDEDGLALDRYWDYQWFDLPSTNLGLSPFVFGYIVEYGGLPASYVITPSATSVNEGSSVTFTIDTKNVEWGKTISYSISGISASDLESGSLTGTAVVSQKGNDGVATVTVALKADQIVESPEYLTLMVGSTSASPIAVNDGSSPQTLTVITPNGDSLNLIRPFYSSSGKLYYFIDKNASGTAQANGPDDFTHSYLDQVFNNGARTTDTQSLGVVGGVDDQRTFVFGRYTIALPTAVELSTLFTDKSISSVPTDFPLGTYWSSSQAAGANSYQSISTSSGGSVATPSSMGQAVIVEVLPKTYFNSANSHYYELVPANVSWQTALTDSGLKTHQGLYGYLATISSKEEWSFVLDSIPGTSVNQVVWHSLTDIETEGIWKFASGPELGQVSGFSAWFPGEPNNQGNEDFAFYFWGKDSTLLWNDANSTSSDTAYKKSYLVEYGGLPATYAITPSATSVNEGSSVTFTIDTKNVEWGKTISYSISGISASDLESGSLTGTAVVSQKGNDGVATVNLKLTQDQLTEGVETLLVTIGSSISSITINDAPVDVPPTRFQDNEHYYEIDFNPDITFSSALELSKSKSYRGLYGYLSTITSNSEQKFVETLLPPSSTKIWVYIGGSDAQNEGTWRWMSGPEQGLRLSDYFLNWGSNEPGGGASENYAVIDQTYKWADILDRAPQVYGMNIGYLVEYGGLPATYAITPSATSVNEGSSVTFTIDTKNVEWGKTISYSISGISASDLESGSLTGTAVVSQKGNDGVATVTVALKADQAIEGTEALILSIGTTSSAVAVIDVPPTPTLRLESSATTVDEGSSVLFIWITSGVPTGSQYSYSISGISSADLAAGSLSGYVTTGSSGVAVLEVQLKADRTTEGVETINLTSSGLSKSVSVIDSSKYTQLSSLSTAAPGEIVEVGKHDPIFQAYVEDWTKLTAGSLEKFNVNGRGNGDNVVRAINVMTILDDPADGRQIDPARLGFWIEQIEEGTLTLGDKVMRDILSGFVYGKDFSDLALKRMDTNRDGVNDISYTKAAVQLMYRNVLGRSWADIVNDPGANWLSGEIEANRLTIVEVAERICLGAEAINSAVGIVGSQNLTFVAFGDGFGG